ncbi:MAG TPA: alpha/beta hydrolase [Flavobacterium sp.]|nr:alpha/beta hydrolase [Flavobacterium sp.]
MKAKDLTKLPSAYFILAERDYFCSDGELFYQKLKENGNDAICKIYPAEHNFTRIPSPEATKSRKDLIEYLKYKMNKH